MTQLEWLTMRSGFTSQIPYLTPENMQNDSVLRRLTEFLRSLELYSDGSITIERRSGRTFLSVDPKSEAGEGGGGGGNTPAKINAYNSGTDKHRVDLYGNGLSESPTTSNVILTKVFNLAANEELPVGTEGYVSENGAETLGMFNGIF